MDRMRIPRAFSPFPVLCPTYMVKQPAKVTGRTRVAFSGSRTPSWILEVCLEPMRQAIHLGTTPPSNIFF